MASASETSICPLCDGHPKLRSYDTDRGTLNVQCDQCGRFKITDEAIAVLKPEHKPLLSAYCRRLPKSGEAPILSTVTIDRFIRGLPQYTPVEKLDNLLVLMGRMSPALGEKTTFDPNRDYPLLIARSRDEIEFLLQELQAQTYIDGTHDGSFVTMLERF